MASTRSQQMLGTICFVHCVGTLQPLFVEDSNTCDAWSDLLQLDGTKGHVLHKSALVNDNLGSWHLRLNLCHYGGVFGVVALVFPPYGLACGCTLINLRLQFIRSGPATLSAFHCAWACWIGVTPMAWIPVLLLGTPWASPAPQKYGVRQVTAGAFHVAALVGNSGNNGCRG